LTTTLYGTVFNQDGADGDEGLPNDYGFLRISPGGNPSHRQQWMVHLDADPPSVFAHGEGGDVTVVPLSTRRSRLANVHRARWLDRQPEAKDRRAGHAEPARFRTRNRDWKAAMKRAGFEPTRSYDLVHSYCTQLLLCGGADVSLVQKARGHRDVRTTLIYTQVVVDPRLADVVKKAFATKSKV